MLETLDSVAQILPLHDGGQNSLYHHQEVLQETRSAFWFEVIFLSSLTLQTKLGSKYSSLTRLYSAGMGQQGPWFQSVFQGIFKHPVRFGALT